MVRTAAGLYLVHAHVECRTQGPGWWRYAKPALAAEPTMFSIITGALTDDADDTVPLLGVPADASTEVRDDYTYRVAGTYAMIDDVRTVEPRLARRMIETGRSRTWPTREPFERVTDPIYEYATWMDSGEYDRVLRIYEHVTDDLVPATYAAVQATMDVLERDYEVRLVLWFEPMVLPVGIRDLDLERSRPSVHSS